MKLVDNILYIEFSDFIAAGWKEAAVWNANLRNGSHWQMIRNPLDKRKPLVEFEKLRPVHQEKLTAHFGNPYEYIAKEPICKMVVPDCEAEVFFKEYQYDGGKHLPSEHQVRYSTAASWLNMINKVVEDKNIVRKELSLTFDKFWSNVIDIIKAKKIDLPQSYRRLVVNEDSAYKKYREQGYSSLIDWRFGNKLSAKVGKGSDGFDSEQYENQLACIRKAASMHQNFDAQQVTGFVNDLFQKNGWPTVSRSTVYNIMQENVHLTTAGSRGKREYNNLISMQHKRRASDHPLYYLTLDGWTAELIYQQDGTYNNRLVVVFVLDAYNKYPLGYAIGDRENTDLIRQANLNAAKHIHELFGDYYRPRQLQSDNYGIKTLTPFYQAMAKLHTPAAVGNAKSKIIEPYFKYLNKKYCQRFPNWSGFNITAKKSNQPNVEFLNAVKKHFPDRSGVVQQIEMIISQERRIKINDYMQSWSECPAENKLTLNIEDRLMVYGKNHTHTNSITGEGLRITINGERLYYDSFDPQFRALRHNKWQVVYVENEPAAVLAISEDGKRRFVLEQKRVLPMDVFSMTPEDHAYHNRITNFNKERMEEVVQNYIDDNTRVAQIMATTPLALDDYDEASLKLLFTDNKGQQKEGIQDAKGLKKVQQQQQKQIAQQQKTEEKSWQQIQNDYLNSKNDFNQYLD